MNYLISFVQHLYPPCIISHSCTGRFSKFIRGHLFPASLFSPLSHVFQAEALYLIYLLFVWKLVHNFDYFCCPSLLTARWFIQRSN